MPRPGDDRSDVPAVLELAVEELAHTIQLPLLPHLDEEVLAEQRARAQVQVDDLAED